MPPPLLVDIDKIDFSRPIYDTAQIEQVNPHRYEMRLLDAIVHLDKEAGTAVGYKDTSTDDFWVRGHIPGRPLMPGVLMIEAAAQLSSFCAHKMVSKEQFIGFGGIENVKFRAQINPSDRLILLGKFLEVRPRRFKMACQGIVNGQMAFEAVIIGMPI